MRIGINLVGISKNKSGAGRVSQEITKKTLELDNGNQYIVFINKSIELPDLNRNTKIVKVTQVSNVQLNRFLEQLFLPIYFYINRLDKIFSFNNVGIFFLFGKNIVLVHDLIHWKLDEYKKGLNNVFLRILQYCTLKTAGRLIAISEATRDDLIKVLKVNKNKINIIHDGIDQGFFVEKQGRDNYIFSYSSMLPHKNFVRLIEGYAKSGIEAKLYISGKEGEYLEEVKNKIKEYRVESKVKYVGFLKDDELLKYLQKCLFYVNVSYFEGAGTTPLEAMSCGKASVVGDIPPVREYCGDNSVFVDPFSTESIADGLKLLYTNKELRESLEKSGKCWVKQYTYENFVQKLIKIFAY